MELTPDQINQEKLLSIGVHSLEGAKRVAEIPPSEFDTQYQSIHEQIIVNLKDNALLTTSAFMLWQDTQPGSPQEKVANRTFLHRIIMNPLGKPDDVPSLRRHHKLQMLRDKGLVLLNEKKFDEAVEMLKESGMAPLTIKELKKAISFNTPPKNSIKQNLMTIDLEKFPKPIVDFTADLALKNKMLNPIYHFSAAYATLGSMIGKVLYAEEHGVIQYCNDWIVNLCPTGSAKTGGITPITDTIIEINMRMILSGGTMAGMYNQLGYSIDKKEWRNLSEEQQNSKMLDLRNKSVLKTTGNILISDECTGTLDSLMGGWDSKSPSKDLPDLLKLTDSHSRIPKQLGGDGYKTIEDCCVSFLGYTQNETWASKFGSDEFKSCGLFGRFIPVTDTYLNLKNVGHPTQSLSEVIKDTYEQARKIGKIKCTFLNEDGSDYISQFMSSIDDFEYGRQLKQVYPDDWQILKSKIVVHAIKCSMIDAFLNQDHIIDDGLNNKEIIDCSVYFGKHAAWIVCAYLAYLQQMNYKSPYAKMETQILGILRKFGEVSKRQIQRSLNGYCHNFEQCIQGLLDDGTLEMRKILNRNGTFTVLLFLPL